MSKYSERMQSPLEELDVLSEEQLQNTRLLVASNCESVDDAITLMKMLGVHPDQENVAYATKKVPRGFNDSILTTPRDRSADRLLYDAKGYGK